MQSSHILFKVTTRSRPVRAYEAIKSITTHLSDDPNYTILISVDDNDDTRHDLRTFLDRDGIQYVWCEGKSKNKIDAINRDVPAEGWDILVNVSDDTHFCFTRFDEHIRQVYNTHFPDFDGVLHYPDGNRKDLMTVSIIGKKYYDRDGYIYYHEYISTHCDDEAMLVAKIRGKYIFKDLQIVNHLHPAYNKAQADRQYIEQSGYYSIDQATLDRRKSINFGL